jgi:hypothetical protein
MPAQRLTRSHVIAAILNRYHHLEVSGTTVHDAVFELRRRDQLRAEADAILEGVRLRRRQDWLPARPARRC